MVVATFLVLLIMLRWGYVKRKCYDFRLRWAISKLGKKVLRNVTLPDGTDGYIYADRLVLAPASILLISIKRYRGVIFAGDNVDSWTQIIDRRSFKFDNPLNQLDEDIVSIKELVPESDVKGYMIFTSESEFPKGKPDRVKLLAELNNLACNRGDKVSDKLHEDWVRLVQSAV